MGGGHAAGRGDGSGLRGSRLGTVALLLGRERRVSRSGQLQLQRRPHGRGRGRPRIPVVEPARGLSRTGRVPLPPELVPPPGRGRRARVRPVRRAPDIDRSVVRAPPPAAKVAGGTLRGPRRPLGLPGARRRHGVLLRRPGHGHGRRRGSLGHGGDARVRRVRRESGHTPERIRHGRRPAGPGGPPDAGPSRGVREGREEEGEEARPARRRGGGDGPRPGRGRAGAEVGAVEGRDGHGHAAVPGPIEEGEIAEREEVRRHAPRREDGIGAAVQGDGLWSGRGAVWVRVVRLGRRLQCRQC
mmetsp:Transcript_39051/g.117359  ORF Transcript_39051/g.117359 Transcript_39051/m.117359 type:complete len:300 (-) Transcript_39051:365-1264(-)